MTLDPIQLTQDLIVIPSVSRWSNREISDYLADLLVQNQFELERLEYLDENQEQKVSLVAKKGSGSDGLAFLTHSDTVPAQERDWPAFTPALEAGRLLGRGSCDMKGPLAAALVAATQADSQQLKSPIFFVAAADEEVGGFGAQQIVARSQLFNDHGPQYGVVTEPTQLVPVYAHKGGYSIIVTAHGWAAHSSTEQGQSSNFLIAPFLAEMAELANVLKTDETYMNHEFTPPTVGFNLVLNDGNCRPNVTAAKTVCEISFRPAPQDRSDELLALIIDKAESYNFEVSSKKQKPFYTSPESDMVQAAVNITGHPATTVPFGTDAFFFSDQLDLVVLGPGDIQLAHTVGEFVPVAELEAAVSIYAQMIKTFCR